MTGERTMTDTEKEKLLKAQHSVRFAIDDIGALCGSENFLLAEVSLDLIEKLVPIEQKLKRINP